MSRCSNCEYSSFSGGPDPLSDICDGCQCDPDTGFGGFTDHSVGRHFNNEEEQANFYRDIEIFGFDEDDDMFWP
jgi:hypothetical protein